MTRFSLRDWLRGALLVAAGFVAVNGFAPELRAEEMEAIEAEEELLFDESPIEPVAYDELQQPAAEGMGGMGMGMAAPAPTNRPPARRTGPSTSRTASYRLASVPNMYGDIAQSLGQASGVILDNNSLGLPVRQAFNFDIPAAGGSRRVKIGENNVAMPRDRVFFMYNHFHNVFQVTQQDLTVPGSAITQQTHVDRYTLGFEKMFFDDLWSCEVRMPFNSSFDYNDPLFGVNGGSIGNLAVILKNLLYVDEMTSVAGGLGIDTPTGSDVSMRIATNTLNFNNDALHLLPWIGIAHNQNNLFFVNAFAQLDLATSGNQVIAGNANGSRSLGYFNEQNLLYLDLCVGSWLYNDPLAERLTSIALLGELHYTSTMQDTDRIAVTGATAFQLQNNYNRQDILNGTVALQFGIAETSFFRIAGVAPLSDQPDRRLFDGELQFQFNRLF
jgi:hypothetical protein